MSEMAISITTCTLRWIS